MEQRLLREMEAAFRAPTAPVIRSTAPAPASPAVEFVNDSGTWLVTAFGKSVRVKDSRGVGMLARLVAEPHHEVHVLELSGSSLVEGTPLEAIDTRARDAYRARIVSLREELEEASSHNDRGRAERLRQELEAIEDELAHSVGLGGKPRRAGTASERARSNVQRRLSDAIDRIAEVHQRLGEHLETCVRTGTFCSYAPEREVDRAGRKDAGT
jgi:hypothetical protein